MVGHWILDAQGEPVQTDLVSWAKWMERADVLRQLGRDEIGEATVSTVFLAVDYNFVAYLMEGGDRRPILWETMVFGGVLDGEQDRYFTRAEAVAGHAKWVEAVRHAEAGVTPLRLPGRG